MPKGLNFDGFACSGGHNPIPHFRIHPGELAVVHFNQPIFVHGNAEGSSHAKMFDNGADSWIEL